MKRYNMQIIFSKLNIIIGMNFILLFIILFGYVGENDTIRVYLLAILGFSFILEEITKELTGEYSYIFIKAMNLIKQLLIVFLFFLLKDMFLMSVYCFSIHIYTSLQLLLVFKNTNIKHRVYAFGQIVIPLFIVFGVEVYKECLSLDELLVCVLLFITYVFMLKVVEKYLRISDKIILNSDINAVSVCENDNTIIEDESRASSKVISRMLGIKESDASNFKYHKEIDIENFKKFSQNIDISNEIKSLVNELMKKIKGTHFVLVFLENDSQKTVNTMGIETVIGRDLANRTKEAVNNGLFKDIFNTKSTVIDNNIDYNKYKFLKKEDGIKSILFTPLLKYDLIVGWCVLASKNEGFFKESELMFYEILTDEIIPRCEEIYLFKQMEQLAIRDSLTGVYNRRYLTELFNEISNEVRSIKSNKFKMSIILFDLDRFKRINDTYGHLFGDTVIKVCANIAKDIASKNNGIISRYGGEEFVIIFPGKNVEETQKIVKNIMDEISNFEFVVNEKVVNVNISVGITAYPEITKEIENLLKEVDWAMYYSKQNGRGIATVYSNNVLKYLKMIGEI